MHDRQPTPTQVHFQAHETTRHGIALHCLGKTALSVISRLNQAIGIILACGDHQRRRLIDFPTVRSPITLVTDPSHRSGPSLMTLTTSLRSLTVALLITHWLLPISQA